MSWLQGIIRTRTQISRRRKHRGFGPRLEVCENRELLSSVVQFDPTGASGATYKFNVSSFAYDNGNALAIGGQTAVNNFVAGSGPTTFQLVFQSVLGAVNGSTSSGNVIAINPNLPVPPVGTNGSISINDSNGFQITNTKKEIVLRGTFTEQVVGVSTSGGFTTATFALAPTQTTNSVTLAIQNSGIANESTGAGFSGGTTILTGSVIPSGFGSTYTSSFTVPTTGTGSASSPEKFDQFSQTNPDYTSPWGNQLSVSGTGTTNFQVSVTSTNPAYFLTPPTVIGMSFNPISASLPFLQEPPATSFWNGTSSVGTLGAINGNPSPANGAVGPNVQFQTTGTNNFEVAAPPVTNNALTWGYWKNHTGYGPQANAWPTGTFNFGNGVVYTGAVDSMGRAASSITIGGHTYTFSELQTIFATSVSGNGLLNLGHQLFAAVLNAANGAASAPDLALLQQANTLLSTNGLVIGVSVVTNKSDKVLYNQIVDLADKLEAFNSSDE